MVEDLKRCEFLYGIGCIKMRVFSVEEDLKICEFLRPELCEDMRVIVTNSMIICKLKKYSNICEV